MKFSNSPYLFLSISLTLCVLAIGLLPQFSSSAVSLTPPVPEIEEATEAPIEMLSAPIERANEIGDEGKKGPIFKIVDRMPLFPGCDDEGHYKQRKQCADKKMLTYVYDNIRYPKEARDSGVEGMAVISFVIEKDGRVTNAKIVRDPGAGTGREALRTVKMMMLDELYWTPGRQKGKPVRVQFNLPVKFKLE